MKPPEEIRKAIKRESGTEHVLFLLGEIIVLETEIDSLKGHLARLAIHCASDTPPSTSIVGAQCNKALGWPTDDELNEMARLYFQCTTNGNTGLEETDDET